MRSKDANWIEQLGTLFPTFTWPLGSSPAETVLGWMDAQQKLFTAATETSRQIFTIAHKEIQTGNGIMRRIVSAQSPEELVAAQRDLVELMSSVYVEQITTLNERIGQMVQPAAKPVPTPAAEPVSDPPKKRKKGTAG